MVEIVTDNGILELDDLTRIKYTAQISDIFNIAQVKASHTDSFSLPKTANNVRILKNLGLVGSTSPFPYDKVSVTVKEKGFDVIKNGWLTIKETTDRYIVNVIEGTIDFFKEIENINIGDLDLSEINHVKDLDTVIDSFTNEDYRYIFGDYNGRNFVDSSINIDYQIPSVRYKYILDKIFSYFGWSKSGSIFSNDDYLDSWVTYPKAPLTGSVEVAELAKGNFVSNSPTKVTSGLPGTQPFYTYRFDNINSWDSSSVSEGTLINNWSYEIPESNKYSIRISSKGYFAFLVNYTSTLYAITHFRISVLVNGNVIGEPLTVFNEAGEEYFTEYVGILSEGDVVSFMYFGTTLGVNSIPVSLNQEFTEVLIRRSESPEISFTEEFKDFKITDFFNDFMRRFGLTMNPDNESKHITFISLPERIDRANVLDWSDKFIRRTKESYVIGSYAQKNFYKHKYINDNEAFNDGVLIVNNKNLQPEKTLYTSPFYSRTNRISEDFENSFIYPIWEREPKEDDSGEVGVEYRGLSGMWFVIKQKTKIAPDTGLITEVGIGESAKVDSYPVIYSNGTHFFDLVPIYYNGYMRLLNSCKVHEMEFNLNQLDRIRLDLTKPIYVSAESSYYILNKVVFEQNKPAKIEAIRINDI